jgi:hypothetical protein
VGGKSCGEPLYDFFLGGGGKVGCTVWKKAFRRTDIKDYLKLLMT